MAHGEEACSETEAEMGVMLPPDKEHLGPPEAGRGMDRLFPSAGAWPH